MKKIEETEKFYILSLGLKNYSNKIRESTQIDFISLRQQLKVSMKGGKQSIPSVVQSYSNGIMKLVNVYNQLYVKLILEI
jgi:hypothetical protein